MAAAIAAAHCNEDYTSNAARQRKIAAGIDSFFAGSYTCALMSATLPAVLDAWRMVSMQRQFDGPLSLAALPRLRQSLVDTDGHCHYRVEFGRDALRIPYLDLSVEALLPLECQRTLERFLHPVRIHQRLGLVRDEGQAAGLPDDYEPVLIEEDGALQPLELIEDELILALPVVPMRPDTEAVDAEWPPETAAPVAVDPPAPNPFAALAALKNGKR